METFFPAVIQGGAFMVVAFVIYHLMTKSLPSMAQTFTIALEAQREMQQHNTDGFLKNIQEMRGTFADLLKVEREANSMNWQKLRIAFENQSKLLMYLIAQAQDKPLTEAQKEVLTLIQEIDENKVRHTA